MPSPTLTPSDWEKLRALFDQISALPPAERPAALAAAPVGAAVRAELQSLLAHAEAHGTGDGSFLGQPAAASAGLADAPPAPGREGQRIGPWLIDGLLGRGGMGEVWGAHRADGAYEGRAAIKVLRHGLGSQRVLERFAQEQRVLARLNHPHIAHLIDAGRTPDGAPYFVMEPVDGQPIDAACRGLPLNQRLALFLQLADAVAFAHRQLLLHRDLKPSNVLVTAAGEVKLLDFGIAKALDPMEGSDGSTTLAGERPFTPHYASPEQVRGEPVGTATDLYSLGVLLYVMLTGIRPYGREATSALEAARSVLNDEPTRPSALSPGLATDPQWVHTRRRLEGDLDNILLKALDKRVEQRYASVDALSADLRAHLAGYPVSARAQGMGYLLAKFTQRNKALVATATLGVLGLAGGLATTAWQAHEAAAARDAARARLVETRQIARDVVVRYADAIAYLPGGMKLRADLLADTAKHLDRLAVDAAGDPALAGDLAVAYARMADQLAENHGANLGDPKQAAVHVDRALALFPLGESAHRQDALFVMWWGRTLRARANNLRSAGDAAGALQWRERQRDLLQAAIARGILSADVRSELGSSLVGIGQILDTAQVANLNRTSDALKAFEQAESLYLQLQQEDPRLSTYPYQRGTIAGARLLILSKQGRLEEAATQGRLAVQHRRQSLALAPDNVAMPDGLAGESNNLATVLLDLAQPAEALERTSEAMALMRGLEKSDPGVPTWTKRRQAYALHHGRALLASGRAAEAVPMLRDAAALMTSATQGNALRRRGLAHLALAEALAATGQRADAATQTAAAQEHLQSFVVSQPRDVDGLVYLAQAEGLGARLLADATQRSTLRTQALQHIDAAAAVQPLRPFALQVREKLLALPG